MAVLNTDTGLGEGATSFIGASQGVMPDRSFETLFEGVGQTATVLAQGLDANIQENIRHDVETVVADTNQLFGYDEGAVFPPDANTVPSELQGAQQSMEALRLARDQGRITETHYWASLSAAARQIRAQYPGYNEIVDQIIARATGATPSIALRSAIQSEVAAAQSGAEAQSRAIQQFFNTNSEYVAIAAPGYFENPGQYAGREGQIMERVAQLQAQDADIRRQNSIFERDAAAGRANEQQAERLVGEQAIETTMRYLDGSLNSIGFDQDTFQEQIGRMRSGGFTPEELEAANGSLQRARMEAEQQLMQLRASPQGRMLSPQQWDAIRTSALEPFTFLQEQLVNDNTGVAGVYARSIQIGRERDFSLATESSDLIRRVQTAAQIDPVIAQSILLDPTIRSELVQSIMGFSLGVSSGEIPMGTAVQQIMGDTTLNTEEKGEALTQIVTDFHDTVTGTNGPVDPTAVANIVLTSFGPEGDMDVVWESVDEAQRLDLYTTLVDPRIAQAIADSGNQEAIVAYTSFVYDRFKSIPEIRMQAANVASPAVDYIYTYNPTTHTFDIQPNPEMEEVLGGWRLAEGLEARRLSISRLNGAVSSMAEVMQIAGIDPNVGIPALLSELRIEIPSARITGLDRMIDATENPSTGGGQPTGPLR